MIGSEKSMTSVVSVLPRGGPARNLLRLKSKAPCEATAKRVARA
jgi:hypothetical protein